MTNVNSAGIKQIKDLCNTIAKNTTETGVSSNLDLEGLFSEVNYYNSGEDGQKQIDEQIKNLEGALQTLKTQAQELQERLDKENLKAEGLGDEMAEKVAEVNKATREYQADVKAAVKTATGQAIQQYKGGFNGTFEDCFNQTLEKKLKDSGVSPDKIRTLFAELSGMKDTLSPIMSKIEGYVGQVKDLQGKLNTTNSTIKMLEKTKANLSTTMEGAYKNVDTDNKVPVFSGAKAELANSFLANYSSRFAADVPADADADAGAAKVDTSAVQDKWKAQHEGDYTSGDKYNVATNPELANLRALHESGMIEDLQKSGMSVNEIMTFVSENWDVGIQKTDNGWIIPNGHSQDAWCSEPVFNDLEKLCKEGTKGKTADEVNQQQFAEMQKAVNDDKILDKMYEAGFTFKEAMYTLTKLFPDAGISYDIDNQQERNYGIVADTDKTDSLYKTMSDTILDHWNVGGSALTVPDDDKPSVTKTDPITFQQDDTTWTFIVDRNDDGKFDYTDGQNNELLGSQNGIEELTQYDYNGDGVIDANDIDEDGNKALDKMLLMGNRQDESVGSKEDVDGYKNGPDYTNSVDFNIKYTTASDLGISKIDLSKLQQGNGAGETLGNSTRNYDGADAKYEDINGSDVINTFDITLNGETVEGRETLNTDSNLETFYKQVADSADTNSNKIYSKMSKEEFESLKEGWYNDDAAATDEILKALLEKLEAAKKAAGEDYRDPKEYALNITYDEFVKLFGADGNSGSYINDLKEVAAARAEEHKSDKAGDMMNEYAAAKEDVMAAVDEYNNDFNEKHDIKLIEKNAQKEE